MARKNWVTLKKFIFIWLMVGTWSQGLAQGKRTVDSLNRIINDNRNSPESRVVTCVRQGEYYINKPGKGPKDIDSASAALKHGEQFSKAFNLHAADGELLFLNALINKKKGSRAEANRLDEKEYSKAKRLIDGIHSRFPANDLQNQYFSTIFHLRYYMTTNDLISGKKHCLQLTKLAASITPARLSSLSAR
jgi:hypothetical protein